MNVLATRLFQPAPVVLAGVLLALIALAIVLAGVMGIAAQTTAMVDVSPFRWA